MHVNITDNPLVATPNGGDLSRCGKTTARTTVPTVGSVASLLAYGSEQEAGKFFSVGMAKLDIRECMR